MDPETPPDIQLTDAETEAEIRAALAAVEAAANHLEVCARAEGGPLLVAAVDRVVQQIRAAIDPARTPRFVRASPDVDDDDDEPHTYWQCTRCEGYMGGSPERPNFCVFGCDGGKR